MARRASGTRHGKTAHGFCKLGTGRTTTTTCPAVVHAYDGDEVRGRGHPDFAGAAASEHDTVARHELIHPRRLCKWCSRAG